MLDHLQGNNMMLEACVEFIQQLEIILDFSETTHDNAVVFQVEETVPRGIDVLRKTMLRNVNTAILNMTKTERRTALFDKPVTTATRLIIFKL